MHIVQVLCVVRLLISSCPHPANINLVYHGGSYWHISLFRALYKERRFRSFKAAVVGRLRTRIRLVAYGCMSTGSTGTRYWCLLASGYLSFSHFWFLLRSINLISNQSTLNRHQRTSALTVFMTLFFTSALPIPTTFTYQTSKSEAIIDTYDEIWRPHHRRCVL